MTLAELFDRFPPVRRPWTVVGVSRHYWRLVRCGMRPIVHERAVKLAKAVGCSLRALQGAHAETVRRLERKRKRARKAS